jgi:membrane protein YqaA with SNARE-associated domain
MAESEIREAIREVDELEVEAAPPSPAIPPISIPEISVHRIFIFLICFYVSAILCRALFLHGPGLIALIKYFIKPKTHLAASASILFDFFLYMCLACTFFPLPTIPAVGFISKLFSPVLIAFIATIGTCVANLNDYAILAWLFRHHRVRKIRDINSYRRLLRFFDQYAFITLSVAAFLPIPIDVIRLLAISRAYPYWKYIAGTFVGRLPRYLILAYLGKELPAKYILVLFALSALPAIVKLVLDMIKKKRRTA